MRLVVLGSSSSGNGYLLISDSGQILIIEAGAPLSKVKELIDFKINKVAGLIASHAHNDHSGKIHEYLEAGIDCYLSPETARVRGPHHNIKTILHKVPTTIREFKVTPLELRHDVENFGFILYHQEMGITPFITDTHYIPYTFPGMNNLLVEANYSEEIIQNRMDNEKITASVRNRVINSHMEIKTTLDFLRANDLSSLNNIVLIHLSDGNSNAADFKRRVADLSGKQVFIAEPGLEIELNKTPF